MKLYDVYNLFIYFIRSVDIHICVCMYIYIYIRHVMRNKYITYWVLIKLGFHNNNNIIRETCMQKNT